MNKTDDEIRTYILLRHGPAGTPLFYQTLPEAVKYKELGLERMVTDDELDQIILEELIKYYRDEQQDFDHHKLIAYYGSN